MRASCPQELYKLNAQQLRTYEEAARNGQEVIATFVEMLTEENKALPEPRILPTQPLHVA